jgi:CHASE3 domain sensor protein
MNSRVVRLLIVIIGIAIGLSAGYLFSNVDKDINAQRTRENALRDEAAALAATISDARAGQMAYVARGQGEAYWLSRVESLTPILQKRAAEFGALLTAPEARNDFEAATGALENFRTLDVKVRESVRSGNALFAADMIFSDGLESMATASTKLTAALNHELQYRSADMASVRNRQLAIAGGGAGAILLLMVGLALVGGGSAKSAEPEAATAVPAVEPIRFEAPLPKARAAVTPKLLTTAQLCRELSRVVDSGALPHLLERAARVLDASGIIVWVAEPSRQRLVPALSHGYDDRTVTRMGSIHRDANNAAAAAYRLSEVRTVAGDASTNGAFIVPLITNDGCVGVLSAEMKAGCEKDESAQALATIFASQLATLVATPSAAPLPVPVKIAAQA